MGEHSGQRPAAIRSAESTVSTFISVFVAPFFLLARFFKVMFVSLVTTDKRYLLLGVWYGVVALSIKCEFMIPAVLRSLPFDDIERSDEDEKGFFLDTCSSFPIIYAWLNIVRKLAPYMFLRASLHRLPVEPCFTTLRYVLLELTNFGVHRWCKNSLVTFADIYELDSDFASCPGATLELYLVRGEMCCAVLLAFSLAFVLTYLRRARIRRVSKRILRSYRFIG